MYNTLFDTLKPTDSKDCTRRASNESFRDLLAPGCDPDQLLAQPEHQDEVAIVKEASEDHLDRAGFDFRITEIELYVPPNDDSIMGFAVGRGSCPSRRA